MSDTSNVMNRFRQAIEEYEQALLEAKKAAKALIKAERESKDAAKSVSEIEAKLNALIIKTTYSQPMLDG